MIRSSPPTFELDNSSLEAKYKALQGRLHPDRFSLASRREQAYSTDQAALVNRAYDILRRPLARARYLVRTAVQLAVTDSIICRNFTTG